MKYVLTIVMLLIVTCVAGQKANEAIQAGNEFYRLQQYEQAEQKYADALRFAPTDATGKYNLANTIYRRGRNAEAIKSYEELAAPDKTTDMRAKAFYNKGAILSKEKKLEESIEAYKNALRQDPNDQQARENLQKALLELKKKEPPKENKQDQKKKKQQQQQQKQKQQQQPKMSQKEAEQRLKLMEQKEKEVQQRLQKEKSKSGGGQGRDW